MDECIFPRVIVTDRELVAMNACNFVFPNAKGLLCRWHINRSIMRKCKKNLKNNWSTFIKTWKVLVKSETEEAYMNNITQVQAILVDYPGIIKYIYFETSIY